MRNIENQFNHVLKTFLIIGIFFISSIFLLGKLNLFDQINKSPILVLLFFGVLVFTFGYIFSKGFSLHKSMSDLVEKEVNTIELSIIIRPASHPLLRKYFYFLVFPLIRQITYSLGSSGLMIEKKAFASRGKSIIKWEDVIPYLTGIEYKKEYSAIILFRKVISTKQEQFNPIVYLYFKPYPENLMILVNNDEEANKVINFLRNLLIKSNKNINIKL